jgi:hypothetical protein
MSTVASRTFRSSPHREAGSTWAAIVDLLTQGRSGAARAELLAVEGIAASVIAERTTKDVPIVVTCSGPRTRIYCVYDEDAVDGSDANEETLGFNPLNGDWRVSLPCNEDDLAWVQRALKKHSTRITARGIEEAVAAGEAAQTAAARELTIDPKGFLGS